MHGRRRLIIPVLLIVILAGAAIWYTNQGSASATGPLTASGTIEATTVTVSPEVAGKVSDVLAAEGDSVAAGDVLVKLDSGLLLAQRGQAEASIAMAEAGVKAAEAAAASAASNVDLLAAGPSAAQLAVASRQVDQARTAYASARTAYDDLSSRARDTAAGKAVKAKRDGAKAALASASAQYDLVAAGARPEQLASARSQADAARAQADAARAQLASAKAGLAVLDAQLARLALATPVSGTVLARTIEPGETVTPGAALLEIGDLEHLTLTVFVPEDRYGQVALGQSVSVAADSFPGREFSGKVGRISDKAEFTPRNVQTVEGRTSTVFAIDLALDPSDGMLKPGMPADVTFQ
jgi:HlyD family secretion protein